METVNEHPHAFFPGAWPFSEPVNTLTYTSARVLQEGHPVLLVFHDHDGEWQFLHGEITEQDECKIICLGCAYDCDNSLGILSDLPAGWMASRESADKPWSCEPYEKHASDED